MTGVVIAVLGERLIDLVPGSTSSTDDHSIAYRAIPGGSPANVALGLLRLGVDPLLLARSGDDLFSDRLDQHMSDAGLVSNGVIRVGGLAMLAVCARTPDGAMTYTFYHRDSPDLSWTPTDLGSALALMKSSNVCAWHTGSLVSWLGDGVPALLAAWQQTADNGDITLSYDPNARPAAQSAEIMRSYAEQFIDAAHIVKASDEDIAYMYPHADMADVCARWAESGPALVVMTKGRGGALAWRKGRPPIAVPGYRVTVVDTVGAGDTISAALLAQLVDESGSSTSRKIADMTDNELQGVLARACAAAALTCSRAGAQPPTSTEVDFFLDSGAAVEVD